MTKFSQSSGWILYCHTWIFPTFLLHVVGKTSKYTTKHCCMGFMNVILTTITFWLYFQISKTHKRNALVVPIVMCYGSYETNSHTTLLNRIWKPFLVEMWILQMLNHILHIFCVCDNLLQIQLLKTTHIYHLSFCGPGVQVWLHQVLSRAAVKVSTRTGFSSGGSSRKVTKVVCKTNFLVAVTRIAVCFFKVSTEEGDG